MGLKQLEVSFTEIWKEKSLRLDFDFINYQKLSSTKDFYSFDSLFSFNKNNKIILADLKNDFLYSEIGNVSNYGDVSPVKLNLDNADNSEDENAGYYKKIVKGDIFKSKENDILLSKVRPNLKKYIFVNKDNMNFYYTTAFIDLIPKKINKIFYYAFRTIFYQDLISISRQGKGYPTLKEGDLHYLKFGKVIINKLLKNENQIMLQIEPIEQTIKDLKKTLKEPQEVINKVFAKEFGFDINLYNNFGRGMIAGTQVAKDRKLRIFDTEYSDLSKSNTLRFSTRYHNAPTKELMNFLENIKTISVKDIIAEKIHRGGTPEYDEQGDIPVIKTAHIKDENLEISQDEFVNNKYYETFLNSHINKNDVLLASTGKSSLGKISFLDSNKKLVVDGHVSIIKIDDKKYNYLFFVYFFRSILGYFQIERDFTGSTNQIELYPEEISKFIIPDILLEEQQRIANEIKTELDKNKEIKKQIEEERKKIDDIITKAIS